MSAPTISTSLTPECLSAMGTPYTTLANACGQPSGPSLTNIASNTQQLLNSACSASCASSLTDFTRAANATCGEQKVFAGNNGQTAHGLISEFALISAVGCVKDTDGSYCAVSQIQTLTSAGLSSTSTNLLSNLVTYAQVWWFLLVCITSLTIGCCRKTLPLPAPLVQGPKLVQLLRLLPLMLIGLVLFKLLYRDKTWFALLSLLQRTVLWDSMLDPSLLSCPSFSSRSSENVNGCLLSTFYYLSINNENKILQESLFFTFWLPSIGESQ